MKTFLRSLLVIVLVAGSAAAQPRDVKRADELFREGRAAMQAGDYDTACPKLEKSYKIDPAPGAAVNLGDCLDRTGKVGSALLAYKSARKLLKPGDPRIAPVEKQIAALEDRAPKLTIVLTSKAPEGTAVFLDGVKVDPTELGKPVPVDAVTHLLAVEAPGHSDFRRRFMVAERERKSVIAEIGPSASAAGTGSAAPGERSTTGSSRTLGLVAGGLGLAALGTGVVAGLIANSKQDIVSSNCNSDKVCNDEGYDAAQSGKTLTTVSFVGWGVGLIGLAAGGYFLFIADSSNEPGTSVDASATTNGGAVAVRGRFW